jgi:CheY-like chemotaxis protein
VARPVGLVTLRDRSEGGAALKLAAAAAQALPSGGVSGRLSPDRVAIVLPGFDAAAARGLARRLASTFPELHVGSAAAEPHRPPRGPALLIAEAEGAGELGRRRVLVVEDEPELAQIVKAFLGAGGFDVAVAHSGREALERCREEEPALLLVDLELPDVDGPELLRTIRERVKDLPAIACSGKRPESAAGAGFTAFFRKPFDMRALVGEVERLLTSQTLGVP